MRSIQHSHKSLATFAIFNAKNGMESKQKKIVIIHMHPASVLERAFIEHGYSKKIMKRLHRWSLSINSRGNPSWYLAVAMPQVFAAAAVVNVLNV